MSAPAAAEAPAVTAEPTPPPLQVNGARRLFDGDRGLRGLDLTLRRGELYVLLGPNGAGKTSLIRAICGRLVLEAGQVLVEGQDPAAQRGALRSLGLVPQHIALYPELSAAENLRLFARVSGLGAAAAVEASGRALQSAGLSDRAQSLVRTLSGGMQRRLHLVAGVMHEPSVILLDEPTAGVDPEAREQLHELLRALRDRGAALLMTTHDLDEARRLADRVGILVGGQLMAEGAPQELVRAEFGDARELEIILETEPPLAGRTALREAGLEPTSESRRWVGRLEGALSQLARLEENLRAAELDLSEFRVREPGLNGLYFRLTRQETGQ